MSLLLLGLYPRLWTVLNYVLAVKLTCGFTGSEGSIIVCTDLDPCLGVSGMELGTRPACSGWICLDFFFSTSSATLQICRKFPTSLCHLSLHELGSVVCVYDWGWDSRACHSLQPALLVSSSALHSIPRAPWYCLCLHVLPSLFGTFLWVSGSDRDTGGGTACTVGSRYLSSGLVFSSRRMMKMRILPLECLTVMFSSKMAMNEQRRGLFCQFVSTQFMLSLAWGLFSADSVPVVSSVHFTLNSTCSHPKVLSTCKIDSLRIQFAFCSLIKIFSF